jgi:sugar O-acyltransferase (sialic acid O-acetyltransferase NeuD family)
MLIDDLLIIGAGGHSRSVADVAISLGIKNLLFWDKNAKENEKIFNFTVTNDKIILENIKNVIIAMGDNIERKNLFLSLKNKNLINLISSSSYQGYDSTFGKGNFVAHGSYIGPLVKIGDNNIINTHCIVEHESIIGNNNHISINSTIAGRCKIGNNVFIGAGSIIKDKVNICSDVIIGAGSVVIKDILEAGTYIGIPVKKIK